jgi:hypothetical protein
MTCHAGQEADGERRIRYARHTILTEVRESPNGSLVVSISGTTTRMRGCGNREPGVIPGLSRSGMGERRPQVQVHRHCPSRMGSRGCR